MSDGALIHVRTPTYRRPEALLRCLQSVQRQTHPHWRCDVFDDCPDGSARAVVEATGDPRIAHVHNVPQKFASANIDACFASTNPHGAQFACVAEDDNFLLPEFMRAGLRLAARHRVAVVLLNQGIEADSGTAQARLGDHGVLDQTYAPGLHSPEQLHLALIGRIGVSNGGVFWALDGRTDLAVGVETTATLQEYLRTFLVRTPVWVEGERLAVWAENGTGTLRDSGDRRGHLRRELDLKRSVQVLIRRVWHDTPQDLRRAFLDGGVVRTGALERELALAKALLPLRPRVAPTRQVARSVARGLLIRTTGHAHPSVATTLARVRAAGQAGIFP